MNMITPPLPEKGGGAEVSLSGIALCAENEVRILSTLYCSVCCTEQYNMTQYKLVSICQ